MTTEHDKTKEKTTKVIYVYGSADCHFCVATKQKLIESKLDFVFYDIDTDKAALSEMLNKLRKANISTNIKNDISIFSFIKK